MSKYPLTVERLESMSQDGKLKLVVQEDGDVIVTVIPESDSRRPMVSIEFCAPATGGGGSPRTWRALRQLARAMAEDNASLEHSGRRGRVTFDPVALAVPVLNAAEPLTFEILLGTLRGLVQSLEGMREEQTSEELRLGRTHQDQVERARMLAAYVRAYAVRVDAALDTARTVLRMADERVTVQ